MRAPASATVAAVSTGQAPGGIGVVRISGREAFAVADRVFRAKNGRPLSGRKGYTAALGEVFAPDGTRLDEAVALLFRGPKSYTGEDVVELSCHGGLFVTRSVLGAVLSAGALPAPPGEFTRRAFLAGKLDLAQAESVMALVSAGGAEAARAAEAASRGVLSQKLHALRDELKDLAAHLSAWADFPEEDVPAITEEETLSRIRSLISALTALLSTFEAARLSREGVDAVIVGAPNVGKSTLLNLLAGYDRAIVTPIPGTTRDVVEETVQVAGVPLRLADTAGLRDAADPVERVGVEAARRRLRTAQLTLAVLDASRPLNDDERMFLLELNPARTVVLLNKSDLPPVLTPSDLPQKFPHLAAISARTGAGQEALETEVAAVLGARSFSPGEAVLITQRQQSDAARALHALKEGEAALLSGLTLDAATVCVEEALNALYALTGERVSDEIIDRVFDTFCVGK